jgi:hypothetical protein
MTKYTLNKQTIGHRSQKAERDGISKQEIWCLSAQALAIWAKERKNIYNGMY